MGIATPHLRCECGWEARHPNPVTLAELVRVHAWETHQMALTSDDALALIERSNQPLRTGEST